MTNQFVGAGQQHCLIFTRNTTDSLNVLAGCVPGKVVVLDLEHHSNLLPWRDVHVVRTANTLSLGLGSTSEDVDLLLTALRTI